MKSQKESEKDKSRQSKLFTKEEYTSQYTGHKIKELKWGRKKQE